MTSTSLELKRSFFSPAMDLILVDQELPYDIFINSSLLQNKEKFIRIFKKGNILSEEEKKDFIKKYHQLYIAEDERGMYLNSLVKASNFPESQKVEFIKDSAIKYLDNLFNPQKEFSTELLTETISGCRDIVESMIDVVQNQDIETLKDLIGQLSFHDFYTYDHSVNVSMYCITIYKTLRPNAARLELTHAGLGGLLHDLGKIKIPTHVLNNAGKLSDEEFGMIKKHPVFGKDLLEEHNCSLPEDINLHVISRIINEHHENVDGTGYPNNLEGGEIHLLAKITAIADFFDAITTKRSYSNALTVNEALALMKKSVGKKIDEGLFQVFVKHLNKKIPNKSYLDVDDDFDPSRPYDKLPVKHTQKLDTSSEKSYGTIIKKK